jgi:hypothetical protein
MALLIRWKAGLYKFWLTPLNNTDSVTTLFSNSDQGCHRPTRSCFLGPNGDPREGAIHLLPKKNYVHLPIPKEDSLPGTSSVSIWVIQDFSSQYLMFASFPSSSIIRYHQTSAPIWNFLIPEQEGLFLDALIPWFLS